MLQEYNDISYLALISPRIQSEEFGCPSDISTLISPRIQSEEFECPSGISTLSCQEYNQMSLGVHLRSFVIWYLLISPSDIHLDVNIAKNTIRGVYCPSDISTLISPRATIRSLGVHPDISTLISPRIQSEEFGCPSDISTLISPRIQSESLVSIWYLDVNIARIQSEEFGCPSDISTLISQSEEFGCQISRR
ncbi:unnamed protein product [Mytilus edulis]|uniref:Uncharacterized protein n=1 Tax=Mytilus edulis TaxID=6550 RepID=A0A8S3S279_MYTED|nr:unnamed protein product [Mytilus edulis]